MFKTSPYGDEVDLDNELTYNHLPDKCKLLDDIMFKEIGFALCYMDYFHPDHYINEKSENKLKNSCYEQRLRVNNLIKDFTSNRKYHYNDIMWYKEKVFLFQDEIENMC